MADWHFQLAGQSLGPVASRKLAEMAIDGRLQPTDLVHRADKSEWVEASRIQGLQFSAPGAPPVPKSLPPAEWMSIANQSAASSPFGVGRRFLREIKTCLAATFSHMKKLLCIVVLERRSHLAVRELKVARVAAGRELFERGIGAPQIVASIRSLLEKTGTETSKQSKVVTRELDREYERLAADTTPVQLATLSMSERLTNACAAEATARNELLGQWRAASVLGIEKRRVLVGYGTVVLSLACFAVLLSWSQGSPDRRTSGRHSTAQGESPAGSNSFRPLRKQTSNSTPKSAAKQAYDDLEILFYEEEATPFVLNLVVISRLDDNTYEIGLPQRLGDQRAILRTTGTSFNSKGRAQIAALGDGSKEIQTKDGFTRRWPVYKEALSETGAFVLSVKDAHAMQADVAKRIKEAEKHLVDTLISEKYPGKDVGELKQFLTIDIDPQLLSQSLIDNRLRSIQREVEKRRP